MGLLAEAVVADELGVETAVLLLACADSICVGWGVAVEIGEVQPARMQIKRPNARIFESFLIIQYLCVCKKMRPTFYHDMKGKEMGAEGCRSNVFS